MAPASPFSTPSISRPLSIAGVISLGIGALAIAVPAAMTLAVEILVAVLLLVWGAAGLGFAMLLRPARSWGGMALFSGLVLALGAIFLLSPGTGAATLTLVLVGVFLVEGAGSILIGIRMRYWMPGWGWAVFSGISALALAALILAGWPDSATWVLGLLVGVNFLTTGVSLLALAAASRR